MSNKSTPTCSHGSGRGAAGCTVRNTSANRRPRATSSLATASSMWGPNFCQRSLPPWALLSGAMDNTKFGDSGALAAWDLLLVPCTSSTYAGSQWPDAECTWARQSHRLGPVFAPRPPNLSRGMSPIQKKYWPPPLLCSELYKSLFGMHVRVFTEPGNSVVHPLRRSQNDSRPDSSGRSSVCNGAGESSQHFLWIDIQPAGILWPKPSRRHSLRSCCRPLGHNLPMSNWSRPCCNWRSKRWRRLGRWTRLIRRRWPPHWRQWSSPNCVPSSLEQLMSHILCRHCFCGYLLLFHQHMFNHCFWYVNFHH